MPFCQGVNTWSLSHIIDKHVISMDSIELCPMFSVNCKINCTAQLNPHNLNLQLRGTQNS